MKKLATIKTYLRKIAALGLTITLTGTLFTGCASDSGDDSSTASSGANTEKLTDLSIGVMTSGQDHWLAAVGVEKGIFEEYGLNVTYTEFAAGINTVDAIVTEQVDIGLLADYAAVNRIGNTKDDTNLRIIVNFASTSTETPLTQLWVNPDEVTQLSDLAGKTVLTMAGTVWDYWTAKTFEEAGVSEADQVIVSVDSAQSAVSAMLSGDGVAFWTSGTNATKLEEGGMVPLVSLADLGLQTDQYFISSTQYLEESPEIVKQFLEAIKAVEEWIEENQEEAGQILEETISYPADQFAESYPAIDFRVSFQTETLDHLTEIKDWALSEGLFAEDYDVLDYVDVSVLKELYPDEVNVEN